MSNEELNESQELVAAKLQMLLDDFGPVRNDADASHIVRLAIAALSRPQPAIGFRDKASQLWHENQSECAFVDGVSVNGIFYARPQPAEAPAVAEVPATEWLDIPKFLRKNND